MTNENPIQSVALTVLTEDDIQRKIYTIRGVQVMLDSDLAPLYQVETKNLNKAVKRNKDRFPEDFMFQLTKDEWEILKSQIANNNINSLTFQSGTSDKDNQSLTFQSGTSKTGRGGVRYLPYAFSEEGVSQLAGVLHSPVAVEMSVRITRAFVAMRKFIISNAGVFQRLEAVELKQIATDKKIDLILNRLDDGSLKAKLGIFFDEAYNPPHLRTFPRPLAHHRRHSLSLRSLHQRPRQEMVLR